MKIVLWNVFKVVVVSHLPQGIDIPSFYNTIPKILYNEVVF